MREISFLTKDIAQITEAIQGRWDRHAEKDVVWAICGRIALVEGNRSKFPFAVVSWHNVGSLHIGILGSEKGFANGGDDEKVVADVAKALENARRLRVDLGNSSKETAFDGSFDVENIQVSGVLRDENVASADRWNAHVNDGNNPHRVTAEQVGTYDSEAIDSIIDSLSKAISLLDEKKASRTELESHISDRSNPHDVTAEQVGAYTKAETEEVINDAISGEVGGWLGNMTVAEINALSDQKKGDSVTVKDSGIVDPGRVAVSMGDDLMWVDSKSVWEKKIVRDKGFVEFEGELRFV